MPAYKCLSPERLRYPQLRRVLQMTSLNMLPQLPSHGSSPFVSFCDADEETRFDVQNSVCFILTRRDKAKDGLNMPSRRCALLPRGKESLCLTLLLQRRIVWESESMLHGEQEVSTGIYSLFATPFYFGRSRSSFSDLHSDRYGDVAAFSRKSCLRNDLIYHAQLA